MRFLTAGESHGKGLTVLIDNFPAGVLVDSERVNADLARRQVGYGRGGRMKIEKDQAEVLSGIRFNRSTGAPIALWIENRDFKNWTDVMSATGDWTEAAEGKKFVRPRPGHADLAGYYKYHLSDLRDVLERASARETAARVAAGAVAKCFLEEAAGIRIISHVIKLGGIAVSPEELPEHFDEILNRAESNDFRCAGADETMARMKEAVDAALQEGTTLGGTVEVIAINMPPGLGSYVQWDRRLDGILAQALMSVQAVKSVSIGAGEEGADLPGSDFHDEILLHEKALYRPTNRAGGLEGGVTNGAPLVLKAVMKPISTMRKALRSLNLETVQEESAHFERSDVTAVPACGVVCEAMAAIVLAGALLEKFGGDSLPDIQAAISHYLNRLTPSPINQSPIS
jgi:chorismate synthase